MQGLKKKRRVQIVFLTIFALLLSTAMIGYAMRNGINYYFTPTQVAEGVSPAGEVVRIGGLVKAGSIQPGKGVHFHFVLTDTKSDVPVDYVGNDPKPDLFSENTGAVITGRLVNGTFEATEILAKHDANYMPKEVLDALKQQGVYVAPGGSS